MIRSLPRQGQIPCIELGIELHKKRTSNNIIIHFTMPENYSVVYPPPLSFVPPFVVPNNNEEVISLQVTCLLKCSRSTHSLISARRWCCSVVIMMSGLRTIPDISLIPDIQFNTNYMAVLNLFYTYYTGKKLTCGALYKTFNTNVTNETAVPLRHPVLIRIIPSQI